MECVSITTMGEKVSPIRRDVVNRRVEIKLTTRANIRGLRINLDKLFRTQGRTARQPRRNYSNTSQK